MKDRVRRQRLQEMAQQDAVYQAWVYSYRDSADRFHAFAKQCPEEVSSFLYGYAEGGRLMMQKMLNLACEHMQFPDEE